MEIIIATLIFIVLSIVAIFISGLRKYIKREDKKIMFSDISEIQILFVLLYPISFVIAFFITTNDGGREFFVPIEDVDMHYLAFSGRHLISLVIFELLCAMSVAIICIRMWSLPPLALSLCIVFLIIGIVLNVLAIAQYLAIAPEGYYDRGHSFEAFFGAFFRALNTVLLIAFLITVILRERRAAMNRQYENKFLSKINAIMSAHYFLLAFILLIPVFVAITLILLLFGQEYDSMVKVWTETTTWTFSQREHPPYLEHYGHYLCTVAACGHPRIVKPLRLGRRHGETIIVNRQLMVANAYEDMLKRHFKKIHRIIRSIYDKYGYPISKHITNKVASDVVYILMKPLEIFFLANLYLFELKPEEVIRRQYAE